MPKSFISLHNIAYILPNGFPLFSKVSLDIAYGQKLALIGANGVGKSTLFNIISGLVEPSAGNVENKAKVFVVPQFLDFSGLLFKVMGLQPQYDALTRIEQGICEEEDFELVTGAWDLRDKLAEEFALWGLSHLNPQTDFSTLSGGEKEKVMLIAAFLSQAELLLFDEPTNNLDRNARAIFREKILATSCGILIVSHDRELLREMPRIAELTAEGIRLYGGNYDFYRQEKLMERERLEAEAANLQGEKQRLIEICHSLQENEAKKNAYGEKQAANRRYSRMAGRNMALSAQKSNGSKKQKLDKRLEETSQKIYETGLALKEETIKIPLPQKPFIKDRVLEIIGLEFGYGKQKIFQDYHLLLKGDERVALSGDNGCGKTTLIKLILGELQSQKGVVKLNAQTIYLDQSLSLLDKEKTLLDNVIDLNPGISINQAYTILANFKFRNQMALKKVDCLSGGELLRGCMAAVLGTQKQPEMLILDEPTNNLDVQSAEILEAALSQYQGALLVVSHDEDFLKNIGINRFVYL